MKMPITGMVLFLPDGRQVSAIRTSPGDGQNKIEIRGTRTELIVLSTVDAFAVRQILNEMYED